MSEALYSDVSRAQSDPIGAPRVRFAPSPTGYLHVGSARTALFNWLFARRHRGVFILRIEDTDAERNREEWVDGIFSALSWLGLEPDEGPYRQSERGELYAAAIEKLVSAGKVYACDCTRDEVLRRTKQATTPGYDRYCRDRGLAPGPGRLLRFRVPDEGNVVVRDLIRGDVEFACSSIEDFALTKSTGAPLFVLANVVDDIEMRITHVIRGEDLLPSAPKNVLVWNALGGPELPVFAHLPILVNERRQKLSKRRDPVSVDLYRDQGYLSSAFCNYLALLGWSPPGGEEIMQIEQLVSSFDLEDVSHSPAFFDVRKLTHFNGEHLRAMAGEEFVSTCLPWLAGLVTQSRSLEVDAFRQLAPLVQERVSTLAEVPEMVGFLFVDLPEIKEVAWEKVMRSPVSKAILDAAASAYRCCDWAKEPIREATLKIAENAGMKLAKAQAPIRVAVTGATVGLPLFESLEVLGRAKTLERISAAFERMGAENIVLENAEPENTANTGPEPASGVAPV
ncbi:MAG: glutamate--tRNA ligase [Actinomycetota bacterium]|nr:glutamate--tRNA ligase [Actinomycetota bacterium]